MQCAGDLRMMLIQSHCVCCVLNVTWYSTENMLARDKALHCTVQHNTAQHIDT
jgi:hypothetical protein